MYSLPVVLLSLVCVALVLSVVVSLLLLLLVLFVMVSVSLSVLVVLRLLAVLLLVGGFVTVSRNGVVGVVVCRGACVWLIAVVVLLLMRVVLAFLKVMVVC